ncbi:MAG TPA: ABC transporter permease, partial [Gemmatimonadaceae bacterium]|nr:ABC transporter permease [Gemmatimonadaceae bacterium]
EMDRRYADEMRFHLDMAAEAHMRRGIPADEAQRAAAAEFGGRERWREEARDEVRSRPLEELLQDARYAMRSLRRAPAFTATAVATLALSVGATTSIFSVVNAVLLRDLPYPRADRIVALCEKSTVKPSDTVCAPGSVGPSNFLHWQEGARSFEAMAAFAETRMAIGRVGGDPVSSAARVTTASLFHVLGARPAIGRWFTDDEDKPGAPRVLVLGYAFWQQQLGGDSTIVGRHVSVNGAEWTVVGVTQRDFGLYEPVDVWVPIRFTPAQRMAPGRWIRAIGLMRQEVTVQQATRELATLEGRVAQELPKWNASVTAFAMPLHAQLVGDSRRILWTLLAAVGFLLLIACANVANLMLARAADRERELAVRVSLGASPRRIVRQLLTESMVLSGVSALLGLALALRGTAVLVALVPSGLSLPTLANVSVDWRLLLFAAAVAVGTGLLFGVAPALHAARGDVQETLKEGGRGGSNASRSSARLRNALVVAEMSLALVLLAGAGLMVRSFSALARVDLGFRPDNVLTARLSLPGRTYTSDTAIVQFFRNADARISAMPGVQAVGAINMMPLTGERSVSGFTVEGRPTPAPGTEPSGDMRSITPGYFRAMGIPIKAGRELTEDDGIGRPQVGIVSETLARTLWPNESAIGHFLLYDWGTPQRVRIVGIAGDIHHDGPDKQAYMEIYRPVAQIAASGMTLVVRVAGDPASYGNPLRAVMREVDRDVPLALQPLSTLALQALGTTRLATTLFGLFGALGLLLAGIGIYGVMTYTVQQRRHEIGVRLALGASPRSVLAMVVRRGAVLSLVGIVIGLIAALAASGLMQKLLFGVPPRDAVTFGAIALLLAGVGVVAAYVPGLRATRVDPLTVLRGE